MALPGPSHPNWEKLIAGSISPNIEFLGTKILLSRLNIQYQEDNGSLRDCMVELKNFFDKNMALPKVQADIENIFGA